MEPRPAGAPLVPFRCLVPEKCWFQAACHPWQCEDLLLGCLWEMGTDIADINPMDRTISSSGAGRGLSERLLTTQRSSRPSGCQDSA
jgi:hypothetical protein